MFFSFWAFCGMEIYSYLYTLKIHKKRLRKEIKPVTGGFILF